MARRKTIQYLALFLLVFFSPWGVQAAVEGSDTVDNTLYAKLLGEARQGWRGGLQGP